MTPRVRGEASLSQYVPPMWRNLATMTDTAEKFSQYAHPDRLVSTDWVAEHIGDDDVVVLESNEDTLLYSTGHIPGALKIDWHTELNDEVARDFVGPETFAELAASKGISPETTVVFYGDKSNWWAAYALWVFTLYGHEDVRLMDGAGTSGSPRAARPPARSPR